MRITSAWNGLSLEEEEEEEVGQIVEENCIGCSVRGISVGICFKVVF